jgi:hypothetical protein
LDILRVKTTRKEKGAQTILSWSVCLMDVRKVICGIPTLGGTSVSISEGPESEADPELPAVSQRMQHMTGYFVPTTMY